MYRILLLIIAVLFILSCTPNETEDLLEFQFSNQTEYRNYYNSNNWLVNVHTVYVAKIYKNGVVLNDTNLYVNNALFFCIKNDINDPNWKFIKTFGKDSLAIYQRTEDSSYVRCNDSLVYQLKKPDFSPVLISTTNEAMEDIIYFKIINTSEISKIDTASHLAGDQYLTYPQWKEIIKKKYL